MRGISQIWLQVKEESKKTLQILLYFCDLLEPIVLNMASSEFFVPCGDFGTFFSQKSFV